MDTIFMPKNANIYECKKCDFSCSKESNWNKHVLTRKHQQSYNGVTKTAEIMPKNANQFECECGNIYKFRQGLYKHKKKCSVAKDEPTTIALQNVGNVPTEIDKDLLVKMLLKNQDIMENVILKNQDVMEKMMEIMPSMGSNNHSHNTTTNSHNTQNFNIQMFLNEHCKNAMNLKEFIESLPITAETYDNTIENGLTKTITNMITNGLNQLDVLERPIHCTDASRKTIYVKEEDNWEKDNELLKVLMGIKKLAYKQRTMINTWKDMNIGWDKDESMQLKLTNLICNSMTDIENDEKETSKIIRAISKNTYLTGEIKNVYT
jgi:hypothetical protein|tara:strand:+ start:112 stop:1071 length:960 start_codon:yes stop_codon:yes gene_type:complete